MSKNKLDALMADPKALADMVRGQTVEGYFRSGTMSCAPGFSGFNRTATNTHGQQLHITGDDSGASVSDQPLGSITRSAFLAGGTRFWALDRLIRPDTK